MFASRLSESIRNTNSPIAVGLDPDINKFPKSIRPDPSDTQERISEAILYFNKCILDAIYGLSPAVKLQTAFYEQYGSSGIRALEQTSVYARSKGFLVILDAKRGDIPNSASAYARAYLSLDTNPHAFPCDALTINPFLGRDGIECFIKAAVDNNRGAFLLVRTSNPGAADLQDLILKDTGRKVWEEVATWASSWSERTRGNERYSPVAVVAGLTYPREARELRRILPHSYLLLPGVGVQGGKLTDALPCFDENGLGALLVAARSIIYAFSREPYCCTFLEERFDDAARKSLQEALSQLNRAGYRITR